MMCHAFHPRFSHIFRFPFPAMVPIMFFFKGNIWSNVFDKTTINATNGLRLPYNDKASMKPTPEEKATTGRRAFNEAPAEGVLK